MDTVHMPITCDSNWISDSSESDRATFVQHLIYYVIFVGRKSCVSLNDIEVESGSYVTPSKCRPVNQPFSCLSISSCTDLDQQSSLLSERSPLGSPSWSETISVYGQSTSTSIPPVSPPQHSKWEHDRSPLFRGRYVSNGSLDRLLGDCSEARAEVSSARPEGMSQQLNSRSVMLSGKSDSNTDAQRAHSGCSEGNWEGTAYYYIQY